MRRAGKWMESNERSGIKRMCCSCLSIADQWRLKNLTKGMKKQFSLNRMSSENEEFSQSKWNFPASHFESFSLDRSKGGFCCVNSRYESAVSLEWNWLLFSFIRTSGMPEEFSALPMDIGFSNLVNVQSGRTRSDSSNENWDSVDWKRGFFWRCLRTGSVGVD